MLSIKISCTYQISFLSCNHWTISSFFHAIVNMLSFLAEWYVALFLTIMKSSLIVVELHKTNHKNNNHSSHRLYFFLFQSTIDLDETVRWIIYVRRSIVYLYLQVTFQTRIHGSIFSIIVDHTFFFVRWTNYFILFLIPYGIFCCA